MKRFLLGGTLIPLDLFITTPEQWGVMLALRTGPAAFSKRVVTPADRGGLLRSGLTVHDGRLWRGRTLDEEGAELFAGEALETPEERDVFDQLVCGWLEPEERSAWPL